MACAQVVELRKRTDCLPDSYFVVLVGDMITEEALPTYMAMLNTLDGVRDETGAAPTPWGRYAAVMRAPSQCFHKPCSVATSTVPDIAAHHEVQQPPHLASVSALLFWAS